MATPDRSADILDEEARFLSRIDPFRGLDHRRLDDVASAVVQRRLTAGDVVLREGGAPGTELYVVRDGTVELVKDDLVVDVLSRGEVFGHPTLLTGEAPQFTARAREDSLLYCVPGEHALDVLSRTDGVVFVARTLRARLAQAARPDGYLPDVRTRTVRTLLHGAPEFVDPATSVAEAARVMERKDLSALLVRGPNGLGIVTDVDLRDKVIARRGSWEEPVGGVMTSPVVTVGADAFAQEASLAMMEAGVNHLPVVDPAGEVLGVLSASSLMALDRLSPFALRHNVLAAESHDAVTAAAADLPRLVADLVDANVAAPALMRIITLLHDAMTTRLLKLGERHLGPPPVPYAWLAFGSAARYEMTLVSDQDNGLAYADTDNPRAAAYFERLAEVVNEGVAACGFPADAHGVTASAPAWRMPASQWQAAFQVFLRGWDDMRHIIDAAISFDFRHLAGGLPIVPQLDDIVRQAPRYARFLAGLAELATEIRTPLGFRQRLTGPVDLKVSGLRPIQNLARYYAFAAGLTPLTTLDRLAAVKEVDGEGSASCQGLKEAFVSMSALRFQHHTEAIRAGRRPEDAVDTTTLRPLTKAELQEAFRVVLAAQRVLPQRPALF
jgi:CBS domain-containing protein